MALGGPELTRYVSAVLDIVGHEYSLFLAFRGGKGTATVLGMSALMLWQITVKSVIVCAVLMIVTRRAVWTMAAAFVLLNALTIATSQSSGLIVLCLALSFMIAVIHFSRERVELIPALKSGDVL